MSKNKNHIDPIEELFQRKFKLKTLTPRKGMYQRIIAKLDGKKQPDGGDLMKSATVPAPSTWSIWKSPLFLASIALNIGLLLYVFLQKKPVSIPSIITTHTHDTIYIERQETVDSFPTQPAFPQTPNKEKNRPIAEPKTSSSSTPVQANIAPLAMEKSDSSSQQHITTIPDTTITSTKSPITKQDQIKDTTSFFEVNKPASGNRELFK